MLTLSYTYNRYSNSDSHSTCHRTQFHAHKKQFSTLIQLPELKQNSTKRAANLLTINAIQFHYSLNHMISTIRKPKTDRDFYPFINKNPKPKNHSIP